MLRLKSSVIGVDKLSDKVGSLQVDVAEITSGRLVLPPFDTK